MNDATNLTPYLEENSIPLRSNASKTDLSAFSDFENSIAKLKSEVIFPVSVKELKACIASIGLSALNAFLKPSRTLTASCFVMALFPSSPVPARRQKHGRFIKPRITAFYNGVNPAPPYCAAYTRTKIPQFLQIEGINHPELRPLRGRKLNRPVLFSTHRSTNFAARKNSLPLSKERGGGGSLQNREIRFFKRKEMRLDIKKGRAR